MFQNKKRIAHIFRVEQCVPLKIHCIFTRWQSVTVQNTIILDTFAKMRKTAVGFGISRPIRLSVFLLSVRMGQSGPHWTNFSWKFITETFIKIWLQKPRLVKVVQKSIQEDLSTFVAIFRSFRTDIRIRL
jgi:hypothetical protein